MNTQNNATPQTGGPQTIRSIDDDVIAVLELQERIEDLTSQLVAAKGRIADRGVGKHTTSTGLTAAVTDPPRSFDLEKAWTLLTPDQQAVCLSKDGKKIRAQLPPVLAESCMAPGKGKPQVRIS